MTISFNQLGNFGHVGNQMFQYAALKGLAVKHNYEFSMPPKNKFGTDYLVRSNLYDIFYLSSLEEKNMLITNNPTIEEKHFHFDENFFNNCPDNINLIGYYQSYKYFEHIKNELLEDFTFKIQKTLLDIPYVAIHVRRGDYVGQPQFHPTCSIDYYAEAMSHFPEHNFLIFSDDIGWCKQQDIFKKCFFSEKSDAGTDLFLMSIAEHNIIANSSFSWWAAWLNKNSSKKVIAPKKWFGENLPHDTKDLIPNEWITI